MTEATPRSSPPNPPQRSVNSRKHGADSAATSPAYGDDMSTTAAPRDACRRRRRGDGGAPLRREPAQPRADADWRLTVIGEEDRHPYDRVGLTGFFGGSTARRARARPLGARRRARAIRARRRGRPDRPHRAPRDAPGAGSSVAYDRLVLATGSYAAKLAVDGFGLDGCFVYRTLDDVERLRAFVERRSARTRPPAHRHGHRRRPARPRSRRRAAGPRRRVHGRPVLAIG